jgi:hypothetical protein
MGSLKRLPMVSISLTKVYQSKLIRLRLPKNGKTRNFLSKDRVLGFEMRRVSQGNSKSLQSEVKPRALTI